MAVDQLYSRPQATGRQHLIPIRSKRVPACICSSDKPAHQQQGGKPGAYNYDRVPRGYPRQFTSGGFGSSLLKAFKPADDKAHKADNVRKALGIAQEQIQCKANTERAISEYRK